MASPALRVAARIGLVVLLLLGVSLVLGRFLPVPSTLMLGRWVTGQGVHREWQPLAHFPPHLARAVIASEDQRFCAHHGVDFSALRMVLDDEGGPSRGASTVSMQVVKNVYLWPGRSYLRKALEMPLALVSDLVWGKRRMMEIYLNVAELGEGVFGFEAAAKHYYGKSGAALSTAEAARLVAILPNPLMRDPRQASRGSRRIAQRMAGIGPLAACVSR